MRTLEKFQDYISSFSIMPLQVNSKQPILQWLKYQKEKPSQSEILKWFGNGKGYNVAIVTGQVSRLVVFDADTSETVQFLEEQFELFKKTTKVVTKKGKHYYVRTDAKINSEKLYKDKIRIDLKSEGSYIVAPPSQVDGHKYYFEKDLDSIVELSEQEINELLKAIKEKLFPESNNKSNDRLEQIKQRVLEHYQEGHRQDIVIYLTASLAKAGYEESEIEDLILDIISETGDRELKMRIAGMKETLKKFKTGEKIKGFTGLHELGIEIDDLLPEKEESGGKIVLNIPTVTRLIDMYLSDTQSSIDYDEFCVKIFFNDREIQKEDEIRIHAALEQTVNKRIATETLQKAIENIAYNNKKNRLVEYLKKCKEKWDGVNRIEYFFADVFDTPHTEYTSTVAKNFFVGAVARALNPGCFLKNILVLYGPQNTGKSRLILALSPFNKEINVNITTEKDFFLAIQGAWICEIPEMSSMRKADRNRIKAVISTTVDRFRPPYSPYIRDYPRRCVFVITSNEELIDDPTGLTRFWPIRVSHLANIEYVLGYRDQLWGEAVYLFEQGYEYWKIDESLAAFEAEKVRQSDEWEGIIQNFVETNHISETTITEIAQRALQITIKDLDKKKQMVISDALKALGFERKIIRKKHGFSRLWVKE